MSNNRWLQTLIVLLVIIASAWIFGQVWSFLMQFSSVLLLFFLAWLIAFVLRPIARWLVGRGMPATLAVTIVYLALAAVLVLGGYLLVPVVTQQISQVYNNFNSYVASISGLVTSLQNTLMSWGVKDVDLNQFYTDMARQVQGAVPGVLQNTILVLQSVATLAFQLLITLILSFYIMKDGDRLASSFLHLLPPRWEDEVRLISLSIEKSFGGFVRGQLLFAVVYAVLNAIVMMIPPFQLDFVVIASIVAGFCMLIPLVGNYLAFIPPMLVILITPDRAGLWLWLLLALFIMQSIVLNVLSPRIMSSAIGLHPLFVVGAMLLGAQVAGLWGAIFGIPVAGALNLIGRPLFRRVRHQMPIYREVPAGAVTTSQFITGPLAIAHAAAVRREASSAGTEEVAVAATVAETQLVNEADLEEDLPAHQQPTLSARLWRLLVIGGSRFVNWAWVKAQARASRRT